MWHSHYENTHIQIYWKIINQKKEIFQLKNSDIFRIPAQNIDCGYSLEPPRRGDSNGYPQSMFLSRNKKDMGQTAKGPKYKNAASDQGLPYLLRIQQFYIHSAEERKW